MDDTEDTSRRLDMLEQELQNLEDRIEDQEEAADSAAQAVPANVWGDLPLPPTETLPLEKILPFDVRWNEAQKSWMAYTPEGDLVYINGEVVERSSSVIGDWQYFSSSTSGIYLNISTSEKTWNLDTTTDGDTSFKIASIDDDTVTQLFHGTVMLGGEGKLLPFDCVKDSDGVKMYLPTNDDYVVVGYESGSSTATYVGESRSGDWLFLPDNDRTYELRLLHAHSSSSWVWGVYHGGQYSPSEMTEVMRMYLVRIDCEWTIEQYFHGAATFSYSDGDGKSIDTYRDPDDSDPYQPWRLQLHDWNESAGDASGDVLIRDTPGGTLKYVPMSSLGSNVSNYIDVTEIVNNIVTNQEALTTLTSYVFGELLNNPVWMEMLVNIFDSMYYFQPHVSRSGISGDAHGNSAGTNGWSPA